MIVGQACRRTVEDYLYAARREIARRAVRSRTLDPDYFGEAAWNILLDLYVSTFERRGAVPTTSLVIASQVPATTGLRHLNALEAAGEIERMPSHTDGRVSLAVLTAKGRMNLEATLDAMMTAEEKLDLMRARSNPVAERAI